MIGQRIEGQPGSPWGAVFFFLLAAGLFGLAVTQTNPHAAIGAALPFTLGLALLLTRPPGFAAELTAEGVEVHEPPLVVPYGAIDGVVMTGPPTKARAPLFIFHTDGVVAVPRRLNVPTSELFAFLTAQLSPGGGRDLPAPLLKYQQQQEETFGPDRVYSYRARQHPTPHPRRRAVGVCLAFTVAGAIWLAGGLAGGKGYQPWFALGLLLVFLFGLFTVAFAANRRGVRIRNWRQSGLVISPLGLALMQGDVRGEMQWRELRKLELRATARSFQYESQAPVAGIQLVFEGATVVIADIYDRPLPVIFDRIRTYWQGREANA
jgi:hypothetical protein